MMVPIEIQEAVERARLQASPIIFVPADASDELREALAELAAETGRRVLQMPGETQAEKLAREYRERDVPAISRNDTRAFLKNMAAIAKGHLKVK